MTSFTWDPVPELNLATDVIPSEVPLRGRLRTLDPIFRRLKQLDDRAAEYWDTFLHKHRNERSQRCRQKNALISYNRCWRLYRPMVQKYVPRNIIRWYSYEWCAPCFRHDMHIVLRSYLERSEPGILRTSVSPIREQHVRRLSDSTGNTSDDEIDARDVHSVAMPPQHMQDVLFTGDESYLDWDGPTLLAHVAPALERTKVETTRLDPHGRPIGIEVGLDSPDRYEVTREDGTTYVTESPPVVYDFEEFDDEGNLVQYVTDVNGMRLPITFAGLQYVRGKQIRRRVARRTASME